MTNQKILEKAIQKAIDGGWDKVLERGITGDGSPYELSYIPDKWPKNYRQIIFNHDFAKALWGNEIIQAFDKTADHLFGISHRAWQYHLQQMVIVEDPIIYLRDNM